MNSRRGPMEGGGAPREKGTAAEERRRRRALSGLRNEMPNWGGVGSRRARRAGPTHRGGRQGEGRAGRGHSPAVGVGGGDAPVTPAAAAAPSPGSQRRRHRRRLSPCRRRRRHTAKTTPRYCASGGRQGGEGKRRSRGPHIHTMTSQRATSPRAGRRRGEEPCEGPGPPSSPPDIGGGGRRGGALGHGGRGGASSWLPAWGVGCSGGERSALPLSHGYHGTAARLAACQEHVFLWLRRGGQARAVLPRLPCRLALRLSCFYAPQFPDKDFLKGISSCGSTRS